jgi:Flp pilus assembly protein TadG
MVNARLSARSRIERFFKLRVQGFVGSMAWFSSRGGGRSQMLDFLKDRRGNYALVSAIAMVPIMGGLAIAVDMTEMGREQQLMLNSLDAAAIATARQVVTGATDSELITYANDFFAANLGALDVSKTNLSVTLPSNAAGGGTLKLCATLAYDPYFVPVFQKLVGREQTDKVNSRECTEVRLKNTLEVALALDNSGSMKEYGAGSGQKRIDLLKTAAKQLVDTLALQAALMKQVDKPVQFALVPFAASVNVGPDNAGASWMDIEGLSPVHHENFNWSTLDAADKYAQQVAGIWYKKGAGWGEEADEILSRFSLYKDMKKVSEREWVETDREYVCTRYRSNGTCREGHWNSIGYWDETISTYSSWQGCIETRPWPYNTNDVPAQGGSNNTGIGFGDPATMFVPMFGPDEPGDRWETEADDSPENYSASNNWWNDGIEGSGIGIQRMKNMKKYFDVRPFGATSPQGSGPNYSCTTNPITPLTDVTTEEGLDAIKDAIDLMAPNGGTNVPEGLAWGWRAVSGGEPFAQGRPDAERGNDKVVIVLTDGANTYYTPSSLGYNDPADTKSIYSAFGYTKPGYNGTATARLFMGASATIGQFDYSNANYTSALNEQMSMLCANAKAANVLVMTVSLDLSTANTTENAAIEALKACSSESRFRKNADGTPAKLFWNATGSNLAEKFKEIADELSNLRIVG